MITDILQIFLQVSRTANFEQQLKKAKKEQLIRWCYGKLIAEISFSLLYRIASPFLDVLEEILSAEDLDQDVQEDEEDDMMSSGEEEENHQNMIKCLSEEDFQENDDEEGDNNDEDDSKDSDAEEEVISEDDI